MEVGLVTAFIGGMLAILSPCAALLLPAFFAATVGSGPRLLLHGAVFTVGLLLVLVPIGVGAGAIGMIFATHRTLIVGIAAIIMVLLGVLQIFGFGYDPAKLLPGGQQLQQRASKSVGLVKTFLLGAVSGVAGFCAGPILGAVLTIAAAQGSIVVAGAFLGFYGLGMVVPLFVIAALWGRIGERTRRILRGRSFRVFGREFHTTSVITGGLIALVGVFFWMTNGLVNLPELLPSGVSSWLQGRTSILANMWVDIAAILVVAAALIAIWWRTSARK